MPRDGDPTLGAFEVPRAEYLRRLRVVGQRAVDLTRLVPDLAAGRRPPGGAAAG